MHYYIDGYNLLFRLLNADDDLQKPRQQIIQDLGKKIVSLQINATLVFDSQYKVGPRSYSQIKNFEIHFTNHGETADEYILEDLKRAAFPNKTVVVTSDKKLAWLARVHSAKTETVEAFIEWLNRRYRNRINKLKRQKVESIQRVIPKKCATLQQPNPSTPPSTSVPAEECLNYYLSQFEEMDKANFALLKPKKNEPLKPLKKKKKIAKKITDEASLLKLWTEAFERNPDIDLHDPWSDSL